MRRKMLEGIVKPVEVIYDYSLGQIINRLWYSRSHNIENDPIFNPKVSEESSDEDDKYEPIMNYGTMHDGAMNYGTMHDGNDGTINSSIRELSDSDDELISESLNQQLSLIMTRPFSKPRPPKNSKIKQWWSNFVFWLRKLFHCHERID